MDDQASHTKTQASNIIELRPHRVHSNPTKAAQTVSFDRYEINILMSVYGRQVAQGRWRDYALDFLKDRAVFSIYKHTSEMATFRIEKNPKLARKQGMYRILSQSGQTLKRGSDLKTVMRTLDKQIRLLD